jgi:pyruvate dehydrogenase E2 component (dihydrolipoamide acetyltransferase)
VTQEDVLRAAGKLPVVNVAEPKSISSSQLATKTVTTPASSKADTTAAPSGVKAMDGMQKAVAKNMEKTLSIPVFRVSRWECLSCFVILNLSYYICHNILREIATDQFDALYATLKGKGVSVSALLAKAVSEVLKKHPIMNAAYSPDNGGGIKFNKDTNIAMAVAIDGGLITPTIVGAQDMDLFSVARRWKELVDKAKAKKLAPAEYNSGEECLDLIGICWLNLLFYQAHLPFRIWVCSVCSSSMPFCPQEQALSWPSPPRCLGSCSKRMDTSGCRRA